MKKIILGFILTLIITFASLTVFAKNVKAESTVSISMTEGASIRLDSPSGLRFQAFVDGVATGNDIYYGMVFYNGKINTEDLIVDAEKLDIYCAETSSLKEDGSFAVSMVNFPSRAYANNISARAYVKVDGEYIYSDNSVTRSIYEVASQYSDPNNDFIKSIVNNCYEVTYNFNGGNITYRTHEEMVNDFLNDFYITTGTSSEAIDLYENRGKFGSFFANTEIANKWMWAVELFRDLGLIGKETGNADYAYNETSQNNFEQIISGEGANLATYWPIAQAFECLMTRSYSKGYSASSTINFGNYEIAKLIETYINGSTYTSVLGNNAKFATSVYKTGYTLEGWYSDEALTNKVTNVTGEMNIYAKWTPNTYNINYVLDGGSFESSVKSTFTIEDEFTYPTPTQEGATFIGWYTDAEFTTKAETHNLGIFDNITLYAKWDLGNDFKISYVFEEGSLPTYVPTSLVEFTEGFWKEYYAWSKSTLTIDAFKEAVLASWSTGASGDYPLIVLNGQNTTNDAYFVNATNNRSRWVPWFNAFSAVVKEINGTTEGWASPFTSYKRLYEVLTTPSQGYWTAARLETIYTSANIEKQLITEYSKGDEFTLVGLVGTNKTFNGWKDENGNTVSKITATMEGNLVLYASWIDSGLTDEEVLDATAETVELPPLFTTENNDLPVDFEDGISAEWKSSNTSIITNDGLVKSLNKFETATLSLTLTYNNTSKTYDFDITIHVKTNLLVVKANEYNTANMSNVEIVNGRLELKKGATYGTYTSDAHTVLSFTQLVPTWSAISSANATVEFQISVNVGGTWSSYITYCSGGWGLGKQNKISDTSNSLIKLSTDEIIVLNSKVGTQVKFKLILRRDTTSYATPSVSQVSFALTSTAYSGGTYSLDTLPVNYIKHNVPKLYQQAVPSIGGVICSATSSTMLLKYKGLSFTDKDATYEHRYIASIVKDYNSGIYGNWVFNCVAMSGYGFNSYVARFTTVAELCHHLVNVGPVACSMKGQMTSDQKDYYTAGHLITIIGYEYENGTLTLISNDPNVPSVECRYSLSVFVNTWRKIVYVIE